MSDLYFSKYLANRYPNPQGRRIQIGALLSGLGEDVISADNTGQSVSAKGLWANLDASSITTLGHLADIGSIGEVENTVILTEKAPLTKGYGDAQLAGIEDVVVLVDEVEIAILAMDPVLGVIVLDEVVEPNSEVQVSYHHTPNPTLEISKLNSASFRLNQWKDRSLMPFTYNAVLGPYNRPQPRQDEYRYRAFDYEYTSVINDPTSLLLNEPKHSLTIPRFERQNNPFSVFFEGNDHPEDFKHVGPPLGPPQIENDLYIIDDITSSTTVIDGQPSFFEKAVDLSFDHISILNFRTQLLEWEKSGDFTGIATGYSDTNHLYFIGFLEIGDFKTIGILSEEDESDWRSYVALTAEVSGADALTLDTQPPFGSGDSVFVGGDVFEVVSVEDTGSEWLVDLASNHGVVGEVQVFPEMDWTTLSTYRVFRNQDRVIQVMVGGNVLPQIKVASDDTGISPDIFGILDTNSLFFGSLDRKTTSRSGWDFVRYSLQPVSMLEQEQVVTVEADFEVLPEDEEDPWYLSDNQGYANVFNNQFLLAQNVGQYTSGGGVTYTRLEPFLTSKAVVDLTTKFRVHSYATGIPAFVTIADDKKEITLGIFDESAQFVAADAESLMTKGFWAGSSASSLLSQGFIAESEGISGVPEDQYIAILPGTRDFEDSGWDSGVDPTSLTFFDSYVRIDHDGASSETVFSDLEVDPQINHVLNCRLRVKDFVPLANGRVPVFWGTDDSEYQTHLMPFIDPNDDEEYLVFCDENGTIVTDGGLPVGFAFEWNDGEYHSYKATRFGTNVTVFVDGVYQATFPVTLLPSSTATDDETRTRLAFLDGEVSVDFDFLFAHSTHARQRHIGVHRGGSLLDTANYDFENVQWLGSFLEVRVRRDPTSRTQIFLNGDGSPAFEYQYSELPNRQEDQRFNTNSELGYIQFGTMDPNALSEVLWDFVHYKIVNRRERQEANNRAIINRHHVMNSPEPVIDAGPEVVVIEADGTNLIHLSKTGMYARTVLSVLSEDGLTTFPFTYDLDSNTIVITGAGLPSENETVQVVFYHRSPYTEEYLESNWAFTRLNEGTPPVPLRQQVDLEAVPVGASEGDVDGFSSAADADTLQDLGYTNVSTDGPVTITFKKNNEAFYQCLKMLKTQDDGVTKVLSPACDEDGLMVLDFEGPFSEDVYEMPPQCGGESTEHRYQIGFFNDTGSVFNDIQTNTVAPRRCFTMELLFSGETYEDEVAPATDLAVQDHPNSYMEDFYGLQHTFNSTFYTLNGSVPTGDATRPDSVVVNTNTYDEEGCIIDLDFTVSVDPSDHCVP